MGREGHRFTREETKEAEGCVGGAGESSFSAHHSHKLRYHPQKLGRQASSLSQKGPSPCYLLPRMAVAGLAEPPRVETA